MNLPPKFITFKRGYCRQLLLREFLFECLFPYGNKHKIYTYMTGKEPKIKVGSGLLEALAALNSPDDIGIFLQDILTPAQLEEATIKFEIARRLTRSQLRSKIVGDLGVSSKTVSSVRKKLYQGGGLKLAVRSREDWLLSQSSKN